VSPCVRAASLAVAFAGALPLVGCATHEERDEPRLFRAEDGPRLHLPAPMQLALVHWNPDFRPLRVRDFALRVRGGAIGALGDGSVTENQALYAVIGDFDGDGRRDVALLGRAADRAFLVAVRATSDTTATLSPLESWKLDASERRAGLDWFISHVPAGTRAAGLGEMRRRRLPDGKGFVDEPDTSLFLGHAALDFVRYRKSEILYYFDHDIWKAFAVRH
jgi:hypothetical protein